ncbi:MAG: LysM peptidoglycan-binding domain-containing protein [Anaerolineales bacterium]
MAAPIFQLTPFPTPTPGADGRIIYIVQPGDTLIRISLISGVPIDELRGLNNITGDNITVGQKLLLGLGGPSIVTPTEGPSPTPTPITPTPTPKAGLGVICILLYNDINGDGRRQKTEAAIAGGAVSLADRLGKVSQTSQTKAGTDPLCFNDLPEGNYTVSVAIPEGYNPTTVNSINIDLAAGDKVYLNFGAQENSQKLAEAPTPTGSGKSPLLGIIGAIVILTGIGLALFGTRMLRGK